MGATKSSITKLENLQHDDTAEAKKVVLVTTAGTAYTAANMADIKAIMNARELWFGKKSVQTATDWADDTLNPYVATSGDNAYGTETQVLGTADTPIITSQTYFTIDKLLISAASSDTVYKIKIVWGTTFAEAVSAGQYVELMYQNSAAGVEMTSILPIIMPYVAVTTNKVWISIWNLTNLSTLDFFISVKGI